MAKQALTAHHADLYEDTVHFDKAGSAFMGDQAAATIKQSLQAQGN